MIEGTRKLLVQIGPYTFWEELNVTHRLTLKEGREGGTSFNKIEVEFDIDNNPVVNTYQLRQICKQNGDKNIEQDNVKQELEKAIKERYPLGFHSRNDQKKRNWIYNRIKDLEKRWHFKLKGEVVPYGGILIDGSYFDAYRATFLFGQFSQDVVIASYHSNHNQLLIFRGYITKHDDLPFFVDPSRGTNVQKIGETWGKRITFYNDFVGLNSVTFGTRGRVVYWMTGIRDDNSGYVYVCRYGKYLVRNIKNMF